MCFYCNQSIRRDKLDSHTRKSHPGHKKREKGTQNIGLLFKRADGRTAAESTDVELGGASQTVVAEQSSMGTEIEHSSVEIVDVDKSDTVAQSSAVGSDKAEVDQSSARMEGDEIDTAEVEPFSAGIEEGNMVEAEQSSSRNEDYNKAFSLSDPVACLNDPALYAESGCSPALIRKMIQLGPCQPGLNSAYDFPKSAGRSFRSQWYNPKMKNGMIRYRDWLVYSPKKDCAFCLHCWLFADRHDRYYESAFADPSVGFSNWKKATNRFETHEKSQVHLNAVTALLKCRYRLETGITVCEEQVRAHEKQIQHNRAVLCRLIDVILFLAKQNMPFRGHRETKFSCLGKVEGVNDGNFLELVRLLAKYDAVLAKHLSEGKSGQTYLSAQIQNELINAVGDEILAMIVCEIHQAKYYGIVIDSTIDISHKDQLSLSVRYVDEDFNIEERFLKFTDIESSRSAELYAILVAVLEELGLDINLIRSQAYDGAANMSGHVNGLQSRVKEVNNLATYVHCCAHRLNLVLAGACANITEITTFFGCIEKIYTFITASHPRTVIFEKVQNELGLTKKLQRLCETRWYCKHSAVQAIKHNYAALLIALERIMDHDKTPHIAMEADSLLKHISKLEFVFLLEMWEDILGTIFVLSNYLQSSAMDIAQAARMIRSTLETVKSCRTDEAFSDKLKTAKKIAEEEDVNTSFETKRVRRRKRMPGESAPDEPIVDAEAKFKACVYCAVFDRLIQEFHERFQDFNVFAEMFSCLLPRNFGDSSSFKQLAEHYERDIEPDTAALEYTQFCSLVKSTPEIQAELQEATIQDILLFLKKHRLDTAYPYITVLYRILGTISVSTAGAERSFSKLKLIKSYLRSTMSEERLTGLALISIERQFADSIRINDVISRFSSLKKRKILL